MSPRFAMLAIAALAAGVAAAPVASAAGGDSSAASNAHALPPHSQRPVCGAPAANAARCYAHVVTHPDSAVPLASVSYSSGYGPTDLASAYQLPTVSGTPGSGPTVAIVDAYDNPNAQTDLNAYRTQFGLGACNSGCFTKVNQNGVQGSYPVGDTGWGSEIDLDIDMVSAACPTCKILLVEASTNSFANLMTAVDYAANHAAYVSNSYGGSEFSGETTYDTHFSSHPGVAITVSSGDSGYGVEYPAASRYVTAVGGTSLRQNASAPRGWAESAWSGAGSGCSAYEQKPTWQTDSGCSRRTVADVSAVADPNTGVAVYDSFGSSGGANWFVYGGTSVAAPFVAAVWALGPAVVAPSAQIPYLHTAGWNDVTSGSNTTVCLSGYLCQGAVGYDGPTGLGTPIGTNGFGGGTTNSGPTAAFTYSCTNLACSFTDGSSDTNGNITSWSWNFGDSSPVATTQNASHTYASAGTYTVQLTVADSSGATGSTSHSVTVAAAPPPSAITLTAHGHKSQGLEVVDLSWTGASGSVNIYRNNAPLATTTASSYTDKTGHKGAATYSYYVCPAGTTTGCSNTATVTF